jgi:hypothetical protein
LKPARLEGGAVNERELPDPPPVDRDRDDDDDVPETPPTEPSPVPIEEPPSAPGQDGPYVVGE